MPSNFEIAVIILLLVNIGVSIYVTTRNNSEYFDREKDRQIQDRVNKEKEEAKKRLTKKF